MYVNRLKLSNLLAAPPPAPAFGLSPPIAAGPGLSPSPSSHLTGSTSRWLRLLPEWQDMTSSVLHREPGYGRPCARVWPRPLWYPDHAHQHELQVETERERDSLPVVHRGRVIAPPPHLCEAGIVERCPHFLKSYCV